MKISFTILLLLFVIVEAKSQNLVVNHSFENAWSCPISFTTLPIGKPFPGWINPNKGTPDLLHICSTGDAGVPLNFAGNMYPSDGAAYAGIILREKFDDSIKVYEGVSREYIQTRLTEPLSRNKIYCVKLFYANASKSMFAVDALGITVTTERIGTKDAGLIIQIPQVINKPGHIMDNVDYWQEMCGVYRAHGDEEFLTIGNFWDNSKTKFIRHDLPETDTAFFYAYYYIDDVRVFEIENTFECGCINDLSFGTDWLADDYDPETGYNSLASNGDNQNNGNNNGNNGNNNLSDNGNQGNNNSTDSLNNYGNNSNNSLFTNVKESEISKNAFDNAGVGSKFNLNRIFFEFNSSDLLTVSFTELDRLSEILLEKPSLRIEIRGHTDNVGSESYNKSLSIKRAQAVYDYLILKGVQKSRMKYRGFGNKVPIAENDTEEGRSQNRRVEIIIVEL
jgi:outer membrane protein OmpA-like peptidoglycan-associated protein